MGNLVFQATLGGQVNLVGPNTASTFNLNVPAVSSTIATLTGTETFTNKTLTSPTLTTPVLGTPASGTLTNCTGLPNAGLVNSSVTVGSTAISLGATATTVAGLTSLATNTLTSAASTALTLQSAGTTAITVNTSQQVGMGTTSPNEKLVVNGAIRSTNNAAGATATADSGVFYFVPTADAPSDPRTILQGVGTASVGASIAFFTGTSSSNTERMRIDSNGNLLVGTTSTATPSQGFVFERSTDSLMRIGHANGTSSGSNYVIFGYNSGVIGSITQSGTTAVLYNTTSDYRLKNNPVPITGAKEFVMALQPKTWDWWDNSGKGVGFIAHEFMEIAKYSGNGEKDAVDADGKPIHQSIQPSSPEVMANIVALMQEQQATITAQAETINALTARIVALEAK